MAKQVKYVPSPDRHVYDAIMNGPGVQADLLRRAERVAHAAGQAGIECHADVRPGRHRAHARASAPYNRVASFRDKGHNRKIDRILQAVLDAARG